MNLQRKEMAKSLQGTFNFLYGKIKWLKIQDYLCFCIYLVSFSFHYFAIR